MKTNKNAKQPLAKQDTMSVLKIKQHQQPMTSYNSNKTNLGSQRKKTQQKLAAAHIPIIFLANEMQILRIENPMTTYEPQMEKVEIHFNTTKIFTQSIHKKAVH